MTYAKLLLELSALFRAFEEESASAQFVSCSVQVMDAEEASEEDFARAPFFAWDGEKFAEVPRTQRPQLMSHEKAEKETIQ